MAKFKDLTGKQFGRLTVIKLDSSKQSGSRMRYFWKCTCECGNTHIVRTDSLTGGKVQSCGCLHKEQAIENVKVNHTHKDTGSRLYSIWTGIKRRCYNTNDKSYERYGARGIVMCSEWKESYQAFKDWSLDNGYDESLTIDRIDNNKGYEPNNCRWTTIAEQCRNRRTNVIIDGMCAKDYSELNNLNYKSLVRKIKKSRQYRGN